MNFSIAAGGIQSASDAFEAAANGINQAVQNFNPLTNGSTLPDSVSLSTQVASLAKSSLDFQANVKVELVDSELSQSTFSITG